MAYTPTNWVTGDTVTATKMNKIENGIANAGGGISVDVKVWLVDSSGTLYAEGDFASALAKASQGIPLVALFYSGLPPTFAYPVLLGSTWLSEYPNQIRLADTSVSYYLWTANGITYVN